MIEPEPQWRPEEAWSLKTEQRGEEAPVRVRKQGKASVKYGEVLGKKPGEDF
jgi:hypothetical protein